MVTKTRPKPSTKPSAPAPVGSDVRTGTGLQEDIKSNFISIWLTVLSIVQGVALGLLAQQVYSQRSSDIATLILFLGFHFALIIGVWDSYFIGSLLRKWIPSMLDPVIPFGIGFLESVAIMMFFSSNVQVWYFLIGLLGLFGVAGHMNELWKCRQVIKAHPSERAIIRVLRWEYGELLAFSAAFFIVGTYWPNNELVRLWMLGVGTTIMILHLCRLQAEWRWYLDGGKLRSKWWIWLGFN